MTYLPSEPPEPHRPLVTSRLHFQTGEIPDLPSGSSAVDYLPPMKRTQTGQDDNALLFDSSERFFLDPVSPVPLYHQVEQVILDRISQEGAIGKMLPSENDLMAMFSVSRATARKAYEGLMAKGLIERKRALGTRVVGQQIIEDLGRLKGYTEEMKLKGLHVSTEMVEVVQHLPSPKVRAKLRLGEQDQTLSIRRLRGTSEFFPIVLLRSEIPVSFGIQANEDFRGSLYRLIEEKYRIPIEWADEEIHAAKATAEEAELLRIEPGDGVLIMERLTYTRGEKPLEFVRAVYRPEHYTFSIRLRR